MEGWIVASVLYVLGVLCWVLDDMAVGEGDWRGVVISLFWPLMVLLGCLLWFGDWLNDKLTRRI